MATLCYFPNCISVPSRNLSLTHHHQLLQAPPLPLRHFHVRASHSATNKSRRTRTRRLKSDAEICNDIRQFLTDVGLPEDHIPSTKELLHHGRNDLANIVRRRGHKQIRELLTRSLNADIGDLNTENSLDEGRDAADDCEDLLTGQNVKVDSLVDDVTISTKDHAEEVNNVAEGNGYPTEASIVYNDFRSSREGPCPNFDDQSSISGESYFETKSSGNSEFEDNVVGKMVGEINLPSVVPSVENHFNASLNDSDLDNKDKGFPMGSSIDFSLEQKDWHTLESLADRDNNIAEDVPSTSEVSIMENLSGDNKIDSIVHSADSSSIDIDSSASLSLEAKVSHFIQSGDLELVEDHVSGISNEDDSEESKVYSESEPTVDRPIIAHPPKDNNALALNWSSLSSKQVVPSATLDQLLPEDHKPHEDLTNHFDKDLDAEAPIVQNQSEINHLKFMLYQKELELSRLKEQIEKEKLALAVLQTKAEAEISKARELISGKDADLHVAEESLSGLKEVQIDFFGDGDVVEVAGSFNSWHHRIKMDPQPSTSVIDLAGSRRSRFWSTVLWLYPGVYEIKFVVDGKWRIDPQRESVTRGHICNNILRVDR